MKTLWRKNQENSNDRISHAWAPLRGLQYWKPVLGAEEKHSIAPQSWPLFSSQKTYPGKFVINLLTFNKWSILRHHRISRLKKKQLSYTLIGYFGCSIFKSPCCAVAVPVTQCIGFSSGHTNKTVQRWKDGVKMTWMNKSFQIIYDVHATSLRSFFTEIFDHSGIVWNTPRTRQCKISSTSKGLCGSCLSVWGPLPSFCLGVGKQFCRFWIWSHTECKSPQG